MKRALAVLPVVALVVTAWMGTVAPQAQAIPAFKAEFEAKYVKKDSTDAGEMALAEAVKEAKCNVCHKGDNKKQRNHYGEQLAELLDKKADAKNKEKIQEALAKVAEMKVDSEKSDSPTFGELIKQGKLPGAE